MQQVLRYSAIKTGFSYLPLALTIIFSAGLASQLVTRLGFKPVVMTGMALLTAGLVWFGQVSVGGSYLGHILGPSLLAGAGLGLAFVPVTIAAVAGIRESDAGLASGLINTSQQIGGALGLAVLATIATSRTNNLLAAAHGNPADLPQALTEGFQSAFRIRRGLRRPRLRARLLLSATATARRISGRSRRRPAAGRCPRVEQAGDP